MNSEPQSANSSGAARTGGDRRQPRAVVVGGGISGLATAALLAESGYAVELLEKQDSLGGRTGRWEAQGFRFDTGPSWLLMVDVFDRFFGLLGTSTEEALDLLQLHPAYRVYFDGYPEPVEIGANVADNASAFERIEDGAGQRLLDYLVSARHTYRMALRHFLYTSFTSWRDLATFDVLRNAHRLGPLLLRSLHRHIAARFSDRRLRQVLGYPAVFLGSSPDRTPSMYHLMSALDITGGVYYPRGGFTELISAIAAQARDRGVRIRTGATVTAVTTEPIAGGASEADAAATGSGTIWSSVQRLRGALLRACRAQVPRARASGVTYRVDHDTGHHVDADVVVAATDLHHLDHDLLPTSLRDRSTRWWRRHDPGPGGVLVHLGVRGRLPELTHHTLVFTADWKRNFDQIRAGQVPRPASMYVCAPSRTDSSVAPPDSESLFLLIPVPADPAIGHGGVDGHGAELVEQIADEAIAALAAHTHVRDLRERIIVRRTVGPADFASELNAWRGSMLGPAHTLRQSAFFRAPNASARVQGLYLAGAGTIPGIGLPMCLISAEIARDRILAETRKGAR